MISLQNIYPLWLREKLYYHFIARVTSLPSGANRSHLEFAPITMKALLPSDCGHRQIATMGFYERGLSRRIASLAKRGGTLVDVGANAGYFTCIWAALNPQNEVYSFEPSPRNLALLRQNVISLTNPERVHIREEALGKETGWSNFDVGPDDQTGWGGLSNSASPRCISVKVNRLDDLIPSGQNISVLKVDTEGADTWVIMGAEKLLRQKRIHRIFFEVNSARMRKLGIEPNEVADFLDKVQYRMYRIGEDEFGAEPK